MEVNVQESPKTPTHNWEEEKPKLNSARQLRGFFDNPSEDSEHENIGGIARKKLQRLEAPTMHCPSSCHLFRSVRKAPLLPNNRDVVEKEGRMMLISHQDLVADKEYNSVYHHGLVRTPVPMTKALKIQLPKHWLT